MFVHCKGLALGTDIELLAQIRLAPGDLRGGAVVASKMWRMDHADGGLVLQGQGEELSGMLLDLPQQAAVDAMAGQIEKADIPCGMTQCVEKCLAPFGVAIERREVQQR